MHICNLYSHSALKLYRTLNNLEEIKNQLTYNTCSIYLYIKSN